MCNFPANITNSAGSSKSHVRLLNASFPRSAHHKIKRSASNPENNLSPTKDTSFSPCASRHFIISDNFMNFNTLNVSSIRWLCHFSETVFEGKPQVNV